MGPFKGLGFDDPTQRTEDLYIKSINKTVDDYRRFLVQVKTSVPALPNRDLDDGDSTRPGEYTLSDDAYAKLVTQLADKKFAQMRPELRENILAFYANPAAPVKTKQDDAQWQKVQDALDQLKTALPVMADVAGLAD